MANCTYPQRDDQAEWAWESGLGVSYSIYTNLLGITVAEAIVVKRTKRDWTNLLYVPTEG